MYEKFFPSFITAPLKPLSLNKIFEPAPINVVLILFFFTSFKNSRSSLLFFGLKKYSASPPKLNQL